ncbi:MAG: DUF2752 domain-containing protein [Phycisphaeraceae bacterium]|nr:DUF2752 domain-containing protein [Phycisphaeraceae bacterium]MCW5753324.1 DUF2752 domain-containing protein [Phycisphaeraceae bacterium]
MSPPDLEPLQECRLPPLTPGRRLLAIAVGVLLLTPLIVASRLQPNPVGHSTHEQLGLLPCAWPTAFGIPCPACGMTTAYAHAARGNLLEAFRAQPLGALAALASSAAVWIAFFVAATGSHVGRIFSWLLTPRAVVIMVLLGLAAWGYKFLVWQHDHP